MRQSVKAHDLRCRHNIGGGTKGGMNANLVCLYICLGAPQPQQKEPERERERKPEGGAGLVKMTARASGLRDGNTQAHCPGGAFVSYDRGATSGYV